MCTIMAYVFAYMHVRVYRTCSFHMCMDAHACVCIGGMNVHAHLGVRGMHACKDRCTTFYHPPLRYIRAHAYKRMHTRVNNCTRMHAQYNSCIGYMHILAQYVRTQKHDWCSFAGELAYIYMHVHAFTLMLTHAQHAQYARAFS